MKTFLRRLSVLYFVGALLHYLDILDLRLEFSSMTTVWKIWIVYLAIGDTFTAVGLWLNKVWGQVLFVLIALSQLIAYIGFPYVFYDQSFLIGFHILCLGIYFYLSKISSKQN